MGTKTIHKFQIDPTHMVIAMPADAVILSAKAQHGVICVWAEVDPTLPKNARYFEVFGTGHPIHVDMGVERKFIDTVMMDGGSLVFHVYERTN
ncbi:hypothetical protein IZ6_25680 [Terrihabitans soli]|uniref:DUF7352 domain-containing protein n=1 Tax=Terrihabitans soli TaxID=708113 RepID=A0A6S6QKJ8_9HYPH|nr:hypothetical protein [Terrihabitans soli]BCJ91833.1 hypothetical protein IZ6_25680 [Terrihabitans soli]